MVSSGEFDAVRARQRAGGVFYAMELGGGLAVDASTCGSQSRFINHSCAPNTQTESWFVHGEPRVGLFALRAISAGEEITYDYGWALIGGNRERYLCGSECCDGKLL